MMVLREKFGGTFVGCGVLQVLELWKTRPELKLSCQHPLGGPGISGSRKLCVRWGGQCGDSSSPRGAAKLLGEGV